MNRTLKFSCLIFILLFVNLVSLTAQTKEELLNGTAEITWLGLDFTQAKFIGAATQFKDAGEVSNSEFRDKYVIGWNQLFINEQKKYDVAKVVHRTEVRYAMNLTEKKNSGIKTDFFSNNPDDFMKLDAEKVEGLVKKYDFGGKKGIGLIVFVDGMHKGKDQASAWAAYVNMGNKTVLMSKQLTGKPGGFGFKNFWAKAFYNIMKDSDYKEWN